MKEVVALPTRTVVLKLFGVRIPLCSWKLLRTQKRFCLWDIHIHNLLYEKSQILKHKNTEAYIP